MHSIETSFGPFDKWEIDFYHQRLRNEKGVIVNSFQKQLIFNLFYKYFNDTQTIYSINGDDYIELMLSAKKILLDNHMILLPYIVSGKVDKLIGRKTINKKEKAKLVSSGYYDQIFKKYRNDKIIDSILSTTATIISSDFSIIDYHDRNLDGKKIETNPDIIIEETLMYTLLV